MWSLAFHYVRLSVTTDNMWKIFNDVWCRDSCPRIFARIRPSSYAKCFIVSPWVDQDCSFSWKLLFCILGWFRQKLLHFCPPTEIILFCVGDHSQIHFRALLPCVILIVFGMHFKLTAPWDWIIWAYRRYENHHCAFMVQFWDDFFFGLFVLTFSRSG